MSAAIFHSELSSLIQESKKKFPDIRAAAEKSLGELKALRVTSESQLAGDLFRKPAFAEPFILACNSRRAKLVNSGVVCLQRLAASHALPSTRLRDVLEAFRVVTSSGFDVQIKILQTLPSLLQTYSADVHGELLFTCLEICGALQHSKAGVLSSSAAATLQQLVSTTFERLVHENGASDLEVIREVSLGNETAQLTQAELDAFEIFGDLCRTADGAGAKHLKSGTISPVFVLDLLTAILTAEYDILHHRLELLHICRQQLLPLLLGRLAANSSFPITIRVLKLLLLLISRHLGDLKDESEKGLSLLIHLMETDSSQAWRRAACAEVLRNIISDFSLLRYVFDIYDQEEGRTNIVGDMMAAYARIAAENPTVIGLGAQSTSPAHQDSGRQNGQEQASLQTSGMEGVIASTVTADTHTVGISVSWSTPKTACLEQLDKNDAPSLPDTYIYSLALDCMSSVSEGLAKFIMPLSLPRNVRNKSQPPLSESTQDLNNPVADSTVDKNVASLTALDSHKASQLLNPLKLTGHRQERSIKTVAEIVTSCWPAFLATCTTFLKAALDAELYHNLVRAIQKLSQVAGVLELSTPRDALLTALGKAAVPSQALRTASLANVRQDDQLPASHGVDDPTSSTTTSYGKFIAEQDSSVKVDVSLLTARNLLCLRAQLNLGIALGPTLSHEAWLIVLETLQQVEHLISLSSRLLLSQRDKLVEEDLGAVSGDIRASLGGEVTAVQVASKKMFASSGSYQNTVFVGLVKALLSLSPSTSHFQQRKDISSPITDSNARRSNWKHQSSRSTSGTFAKVTANDDELQFVLSKLSEIARSNLQRFASESAIESGWIMITDCLLYVVKSSAATSDLRIRATTLTHSILLGTLNSIDEKDKALQKKMQQWSFSVLQNQIDGLYQRNPSPASSNRSVDHQIHERVIEVLLSIVEQHGENLLVGWAAVFELASSIFGEKPSSNQGVERQSPDKENAPVRSMKLLTRSFRLVQLVGSDFLSLLAPQDLLSFIEIMLLFGRQENDLNISLTSTTFFQNLADFLYTQDTQPSLDSIADLPTDGDLVRQIANDEDSATTIGRLWLILLLRLGSLTTDSRFQVRNSAIRVMFRIADMSGASLSPHGCYVCLVLVLLPLLKSQGAVLASIWKSASELNFENIGQWHDSTVALVDGGLRLVAKYIPRVSADGRFPVFWKHLFESLECILASPAPAVSYSIFRGLVRLFASLQKLDLRDASMAKPALELWVRNHPANIMAQGEGGAVAARHPDANQEPFSAHAEFLIRVHDAIPSSNLAHISAEDIFRNLRKTIVLCIHAPYESDILKIAPEQEHVVSSLELLSKTMRSNSAGYGSTLLAFTQIAFRDEDILKMGSRVTLLAKREDTLTKGQVPTFVAFSSRCMDIVENDISRSIRYGTTADNLSFVSQALDVLSDVVKAKYTVRAHRGEPLLWRKAASTGLKIVEAVASHSDEVISKGQHPALNKIYESSIEFMAGILGSGMLERPTDLSGKTAVEYEEDQDIAAFKRLSSTLISALSKLKSSSVTEQRDVRYEVQRKFVISLFEASLLATPYNGDFPCGDNLVRQPLSSFHRIRPGTIKEPMYQVRERIAYLALDTLFTLTAKVESDRGKDGAACETHEALAITAAPYMLLRATHTLKWFIADQPLRGAMPMPCRLRAEMICVLRHCLEHRSGESAFVSLSQPSTSVDEDDRRHLGILYPLVLQALKVWRGIPRYGTSWTTDKDGAQIEDLLHQWMGVCGENWGLADIYS